jgi:hypothetical protein
MGDRSIQREVRFRPELEVQAVSLMADGAPDARKA